MTLISTPVKSRPQPRRNRPLEEIQEEQKQRKPFKVGKVRLKSTFIYLLVAGGVLVLLALANGYQESIVCKDISVTIHEGSDNAFLDMNQVKQIIGLDHGRDIIGERMSGIELFKLEEALKRNPYIEQAEVYKNLQGVLYVDVTLRKPVARVMSKRGSTFYVDAEGRKMPVTRQHVANLPLVRGYIAEKLTPVDTLKYRNLASVLPILRHLERDEFWAAQVAEIRIHKGGEVTLYPRIGRMKMEFGQPDRVEEKFQNLRLFYAQVVDEIGWKKYRSVNVKYRGQVVGKR
ncbi:MAG: hypothetical protein AAGI38_10895 [Bacteroidota bacterium]